MFSQKDRKHTLGELNATAQKHLMHMQQTAFEIIVAKEEIAQNEPVFPFATIFSTRLNNISFI